MRTQEEYRAEFFEYLIENNLTEQDWISIDLQPHIPERVPGGGMPDLVENLKFPYLECFLRNGYRKEIRENRYYTMVVDPYLEVKEDLKSYIRNKKIDQLGI